MMIILSLLAKTEDIRGQAEYLPDPRAILWFWILHQMWCRRQTVILPKRNRLFKANIMSGKEEYTRRQASQCKVTMSIHIIGWLSQKLKYSFPPPESSTTPLVQLAQTLLIWYCVISAMQVVDQPGLEQEHNGRWLDLRRWQSWKGKGRVYQPSGEHFNQDERGQWSSWA